MDKLYKTVITIYTDYDPTRISVKNLAEQSDSGDAFCFEKKSDKVLIDENIPDEVSEFFNIQEEEGDLDEYDGDSDEEYHEDFQR